MRFYYASVELRAHKGRVRWADHRPNPFAVRPWSVGEPWARGITPATEASLTVLDGSDECAQCRRRRLYSAECDELQPAKVSYVIAW